MSEIERRLSLKPDPWMRWIYDYRDPRYNDPQTIDLRNRRDAAIRSAPRWMIEMARTNDLMRKANK